jgi:hypothetical protein
MALRDVLCRIYGHASCVCCVVWCVSCCVCVWWQRTACNSRRAHNSLCVANQPHQPAEPTGVKAIVRSAPPRATLRPRDPPSHSHTALSRRCTAEQPTLEANTRARTRSHASRASVPTRPSLPVLSYTDANTDAFPPNRRVCCCVSKRASPRTARTTWATRSSRRRRELYVSFGSCAKRCDDET